jgi:hypothetical protein
MNEDAFFVVLALLAALMCVNVFSSRKVWRADVPRNRRILALVWIWLLPFVGILIAHGMAGGAGPVAQAGSGRMIDEPAPAELRTGTASPFPLLEHLKPVHGLPLPDWTAVTDWLADVEDDGERTAARNAAGRAWLLHLRDAYDERFYVFESDHVILLASVEVNVAAAMADYIATTRKRVARVLEGVAKFEAGDKSILLVMDNDDAYYNYVTVYYPEEGEFSFSSGMFINAGCPHFVVPRANLNAVEPVIAHELTHSAVRHLQLPLWLNEGLAVNTEHRLAGAHRSLFTPQEMRQKHLDFWGEAEIQQFWSGRSFLRSDDGNMLSYDLARIMVEQLGRDWTAFARFANGARREDAGLAAAEESMGVDLTAFVCSLLDRETDVLWMPDRTAWEEVATSA